MPTRANDLASDALLAYNLRIDALLTVDDITATAAVVAFCEDVTHDAVLFGELSTVDDELEESEMWISSKLQEHAGQLLDRLCALLRRHGIRHVMDVDAACAVPGALSVMMLFSRSEGDGSKAVQGIVLDAMEVVVGRTLRPRHRDDGDDPCPQSTADAHRCQFHWSMAAAIMTQSQHRTSSVKLARYCEIIATVPTDQDPGDRLGVVDAIQRCAESSHALTSSDDAMLRRVALRLLAFSLSSRSRRCVLVESSGRFYSELGRLGMLLPKLALHGSDMLLSIACALLNVLSDDHGRMFDADPSIGEFFTVVIRELLGTKTASADASNDDTTTTTAVGHAPPQQQPACWATRGVRNWNIEMVLRNNDISTGHKVNGAVAIKIKELQAFFCARGDAQHHLHPGAAVLLRSLRNVFHDARLLETGVSVVIRNIAVSNVQQQLNAHARDTVATGCTTVDAAGAVDSPRASHPMASRALMHHFKLTLVMLANIIRDGGAHQTASALLLLTQGASLGHSGGLSGDAEDAVAREQGPSQQAVGSAATPTTSNSDGTAGPMTLLQGLMSLLLNDDGLRDQSRCRALVLMETVSIVEAAWRQSPRDFAPHLTDARVLQILHAAVTNLLAAQPHADDANATGDAYSVCADDISLHEAMLCHRKVCTLTVEVVDTHADVREALLRDPAARRIPDTFVRLWHLARCLNVADNTNDACALIRKLVSAAPSTKHALLAAMDVVVARSFQAFVCAGSIQQADRGDHLRTAWQGLTIQEELLGLLSLGGESVDGHQARIDTRKRDVTHQIVQWMLWSERQGDEWQGFLDLASQLPGGVVMAEYLAELHMVGDDKQKVLSRAFDRIVSNEWSLGPPDIDVSANLLRAYVHVVLHRDPDPTRCKHQAVPASFVKELEIAYTSGALAGTGDIRGETIKALEAAPDLSLETSTAIIRCLLPLSAPLQFHVATTDLRRMLDVALRCLTATPHDVAAQVTLVEVLKEALLSWSVQDQTQDANETLSAWLAAADVVTVAVHALEATYCRWSAVPLHLAVHVYALHCVLAQGASLFQQTMGPAGDVNAAAGASRAAVSLWEEIMSRVQGVLAESVMKFLLAVPSMPHACVGTALPLLESLAFQVTQLMTDAAAVAFWIRVARDGVIDHYPPLPAEEEGARSRPTTEGAKVPRGVQGLWLLRLFNTIVCASLSGPDALNDVGASQRAANLTLLGFQILDVIIGHADALDAAAIKPYCPAQITETLATADALLTVAWTALAVSAEQSSTDDDQVSVPFTPQTTLRYAARSHKLFLQDNGLSQHAVLPLMQALADPNLASDDFYNRARNGVFGALRCTLTAVRCLEESNDAAAWHSTTQRIAAYGCTALEQLSFLNTASFSAVAAFVANEAGMEAFLNRTASGVDVAAGDEYNVVWGCNEVLARIVPPTTDTIAGATNSERLCLSMVQSAAATATTLRWRSVAHAVERLLALEAQQLHEDLRSAVAFEVVVTPEMFSNSAHRQQPTPPSIGERVMLFDATVFLTEMQHHLGPSVFFREFDSMHGSNLFAFVQVDGIPNESLHGEDTPGVHHCKEQAPKKGQRDVVRSNHGKAKFHQGAKATKKSSAEHGKHTRVGEKAPPAANKATSQSSKLSKLYVCVRQPSTPDECQTEDAVWHLNRLQLPPGERNSMLFMMTPPMAVSTPSPPPHPFVGFCRRDALAASADNADGREERKRIVSECCQSGFTLLLVGTLLRHCASLLQGSGSFVSDAVPSPDEATTSDVVALLCGCFQFVAYFNQRDLALAMKAPGDPLRKDAELLLCELSAMIARGRNVNQSHRDEDAFSLLLVLLACQMMSLSDLASCKTSFHYRAFGTMRLDRYGAADDRDSFNDGSDVSDNTLSQDNEGEDAFHADDSFASSSPDAIFASSSRGSGSDIFDDLEDEGDDTDSVGSSGSIEMDADAYDRRRNAETAKRHLVKSLDKLFHALHSEIASSSLRLSYAKLSLATKEQRVRPAMLQADVPLGENGRWSRYYNHLHTESSIEDQLCFLVDLRHLEQPPPPHEAATAPPKHSPDAAVASLVDVIAPLLSLRSRRAQRTLHHIVELVCQLDAYMMPMLTRLMDVADRTPKTRLFVLRIVYTVTSSGRGRCIAQAAPAASMDEVQPYDLKKVAFLQRLLRFLSTPTMSVLSQRMITYIMTSAYSHHDDDEFNDDELDDDEQGGGASSDGWEAVSGGANHSAGGSTSTSDNDVDDLNDDDLEDDRHRTHNDRGTEEHFSSATAKLRKIISATTAKPHSPLRPRVQLSDERKVSIVAPPHPHPLYWTNTWDIPDYRGYTCDVCDRNYHGYSYHCRECMYDACLHCVLSAMQQRRITNDDFDVGGGPYYEPTNDYEAEERHRSSSSNFAHDQFHRLCAHTTPRVYQLLLATLEDANCVDGCTDFLADAVAAFVHAALFPWEHPSQSKQPPFLPRITREEVFAEVTPFVAKWSTVFLDHRMKRIDVARRAVARLQTPQPDAPLWRAEDVGPIIFAMDSLHSEAQRGSQVYQLLPLCVELCVNQQHLNIIDGLLQKAWDTLIAHYELLTTVLKNLDERVHNELYGVVTMSQGNFTLLVIIGKYYRAINWRNSYVAAAAEKPPEQRQHNLLHPLVCTAGPSELRAESTVMLVPSTSELFGLDDQQSQPVMGAAQLSTSEVVQHMKKSELILELLARRRSKGGKPTDRSSRPATTSGPANPPGTAGEHPSRPGTAAATAAKEVKSEMEDPWNEQRSEEISSIVGFAKSYRTALNFLIASRNDPNATLDDGIDFLLNSSKILDFSIRLAAFRAKMVYFHDNAEDQLDIAVSRTELLVSTFREMFSFEVDAAISKENALVTQIDVAFSEEEAMDAGGVKREWLTLVFQRIIQLTDQRATSGSGHVAQQQAPSATDAADGATLPEAEVVPKQLLDTLDEDFPRLFVRSGDASGSAFELNPAIEPSDELMSIAKATGMLIGIALSYDVPIDLHLTRAMYSHMIGRQPTLKDLEATDPDLYKNLRYITELQTEEEMEALCLAFTAPCIRGDQQNGEIALVPNGADIPVTLANRNDYIRRRADHRMTKQSRHLMLPLLEGFHLTMPIGFLQCFTAEDLELVSCGVSSVDVEDLRAHSAYEGYQIGSPQVRWFWECCATMPQQDLVKLVQFATASTRPPAGGFASLHPPLTLVRCAESANLPVAHTCMNRIDLPQYPNAVVLREKLKQALALGNVGFGLV